MQGNNNSKKSKGLRGKNKKGGVVVVKRQGGDRLYKTINPISQRTKAVVSYLEIFTSQNGSAEITFSSGNTFLNLAGVCSTTDFSNTADAYLYFMLDSVTIDLVRSTDEATIVTNLRGQDIYLNYYPSLISTAVSYGDISVDNNSYKIDTMTFDDQKVVIKPPNYLALITNAGVDYWLNPKLMEVRYATLLPGEIAMRSNNSTNNNATTTLFKLRFKYHFTFFHRK